MIQRWLPAWSNLDRRTKLIAAGAAGAAVMLLFAIVFVAKMNRGCRSRDDVAARVSITSSELQGAAAQGKISVERLAEGIKRLNAAATAYETNQDAAAFCEVLDSLDQELSTNGK